MHRFLHPHHVQHQVFCCFLYSNNTNNCGCLDTKTVTASDRMQALFGLHFFTGLSVFLNQHLLSKVENFDRPQLNFGWFSWNQTNLSSVWSAQGFHLKSKCFSFSQRVLSSALSRGMPVTHSRLYIVACILWVGFKCRLQEYRFSFFQQGGVQLNY